MKTFNVVLQFVLNRNFCGVLHTRFDVHIKLSSEVLRPHPSESWDLPTDLVQAGFENVLGLGGGEDGASIQGFPLKGMVKNIIDHSVTLESGPGVAGVVSLHVH